MKKTRFGFLLLLLLLPVLLGAVDFGLLLNQYGEFGNFSGDDYFFEYNASLVPRVSLLVGDAGSFFASASMTIGYRDEFFYYPELLRTELSLTFDQMGLKIGRFLYSDPLSYIAEGLFDGLNFTHTSSAGKFGFGAWYTGFLYKKNVNITMTEGDQALYATPLDYGEFFDTYFAPRRLIASLNWDHPSVGEILRVNTAILGQIDFTKAEGRYHNQYFIFKVGVPVDRFLFELGGSVEAAQRYKIVPNDDGTLKTDTNFDFELAFSAELGFSWSLPASFNSKLSFTGRYSSGVLNDTLREFVPITSKSYGEIFGVKMTALSVITLDYTARIIDSFGVNFTTSYFIRNDKVTLHNYPVSGDVTDNYFLGGELYGKLIWSPVSDLQIRFGGGAFLPALGNVWSGAKSPWKMDLTAIFAIF